MAQFDAYRNRGRLSAVLPFIVSVQSSWFDDTPRRLVIPLLDRREFTPIEPRIHLEFIIQDRRVVLDPLQLAAVQTDRLGERVGPLADHGDDIIAAIDLLISRAYG